MEKCPRCELNYKRDEEKYCKICMNELGGAEEENAFDMCIICGTNVAIDGENVCENCMKHALDDEDMDATEKEVGYDDNDMDDYNDFGDDMPEDEGEIDEEYEDEFGDGFHDEDEE